MIYRIKDDWGQFVCLQCLCDDINGLGRRQHSYSESERAGSLITQTERQDTQLYHVSSDIFKTCIDLFLYKLCGNNKDVLYAKRVLRCEPCRSCESINTVGSQNSLVGF